MIKRSDAVGVLPVEECCPSVLDAPIDVERAADLASGFAALGDPARLPILSMLAAASSGEVCVC